MQPTALVRAVPDTLTDALVDGERPTIDVDLARRQHVEYRKILASAGYAVSVIDADENHPDCPFIEDTALVLDTFAVITRPGAPSRRGETTAVTTALGELMPTRLITKPGTVDGGDVLRIRSTLYVGRSSRTNHEGIRQLEEIATEDGMRVVAVPVDGVLHLKSAAAVLDDETILVASHCTDPTVFSGLRLVEKLPAEARLASVLRLHNGVLVAATGAPETLTRIEASGFDVMPLDVSEFQAADGGLTCLSILIDR